MIGGITFFCILFEACFALRPGGRRVPGWRPPELGAPVIACGQTFVINTPSAPPPPPPPRLNQVALHCGELFPSLRGWLPWQLSSLEPPHGGGGDVCARGFDTSVRRSRRSWPRPVITPPELSRGRSRRGGWQAKTRTKLYGDRGRPGQWGERPGVLQDPAPQLVAEHAGSAVVGHAVSGGCDGRRGGLLPPFPRGFCAGGQNGGGGEQEEAGGAGGTQLSDGSAAGASHSAGQEDHRHSPARVASEEEEEEEEEKTSSRCLLSWPRSTSTTAVSCFVFCAMLGSTVDTIFASVYRAFLKRLTHCPRSSLLGSGMQGWF